MLKYIKYVHINCIFYQIFEYPIYKRLIKSTTKRIKKILKNKEKYSPITIKIIIGFILPNLKNLKYCKYDKFIENTSNKLENFFQKMFPKSLKKKIKTKEGIEARMYLKLRNWNLNGTVPNPWEGKIVVII